MAGIVFPVLLHLWNNRRGKVLPIGSIQFLERDVLRKARSRRISEWWLLLLRCLLLAALALLLAGPSYKRTDRAKGWVLVSDDTLSAEHRAMADSLVKAGYERQLLAAPYWEHFAALDRQAPAALPFYIFSDARAGHFSGRRPVTGRAVHWYADLYQGDTPGHWVDRAWLYTPDSMRVLTVSSRTTGSVYNRQDQATDGNADSLKMSVLIYTDKRYSDDGRYLSAAIHSLQELSRLPVRLCGEGERGEIDWVFWLSSKPVPGTVKAKHLLRYEEGSAASVDTRLRGMGAVVTKLIVPADGARYEPAWQDGYGRVILGLERKGGVDIFHFYSRFDPGWNGMVWDRAFPVWLLGLLQEREPFPGGLFTDSAFVNRKLDRRMLDPAQVVPLYDPGVRYGTDAGGKALDLVPFCWVLTLLLFALERTISHYAGTAR